MARAAAEAAAVSAAALFVTLIAAGPVLWAPSERIFGMEAVGRHHDPFTVMEQFSRPISFNLYSQPLTDVPGALLARVSGPVAAYNWLVLMTFPLAAATAYLLARHFALSPAAAAIAAFAFAFSPFHLAHAAYHPHVAQIQWVPLYFLALWRCLDRSSPAALSLLALSVVGVTLSNFYGGLMAAVLTPAAVAAYWFFKSSKEPKSTGRLAITIGSLAVAAAAGAVYVWRAAPAVVVNPAAFAFPREDLIRYSARWWSYLVPPVEHPLFGEIAKRIWADAGMSPGLLEQQVSLGWGLLALSLVAVFAWLLRRRHQTSLAAVPVLAVVAIVAAACSLSPEGSIGGVTFARPSAVIYGVMPMFRSYARFGVVVQLTVAILAAVGAERLWYFGAPRARLACVALLVFTAGEYAVWPPELWRDVLPTAAHRWVARQPNPIRVLDCAPLTSESRSIQWLSGDRISPGGGWLDDCTEPNVADKLSAAGYSHLLVRRNTQTAMWFSSRSTPEGMRPAARFDDGEVFAVNAKMPSVYTVEMTAFYSREYDPTWTWRWMGPQASWNIVNSRTRPIVAAVDVEMAAFPGARRLQLLLDGSQIQTLTVADRRGTSRIGPFALTPGNHELVFRPEAPPTVARDVISNGDSRPLSVAVGTWRWIAQEELP